MPQILPRVAAVQDISGVGRCALSVVLPVLSAMGCQCCPLPTAYLSASTLYPSSDCFVIRDMTQEMNDTIRHWNKLHIFFDAVYSGFLASLAQIRLLQSYTAQLQHDGTLILVDPVMADNGKLYRTYTTEMCREMCTLATKADIITPNLTEGAILLGESLDHLPKTETELRTWLDRLSLRGKRSVVLTGVQTTPDMIGAVCFDRESGTISICTIPATPVQFPGTGDLFTSVLLGNLLRGNSLEASMSCAVQFVGRCAAYTAAQGASAQEGVQFELFLHKLAEGNGSYPSGGKACGD